MSFDMEDDLFRARAEPAVRRPAGAGNLVATILLLILLIVVGAVLSFFVILQQTGIAACSANPAVCDHELLGVTTWITPAVVLVGIVLSIVSVGLRRPASQRRTWWVPLLGLGLTVIAFVVASMLVAEATRGATG
ncbi:DUF6264 family protein [Microbacterium sp. X-17]|uniref:DUF6264 family protein n=1 Tax=Microbacterium sp. X-17 TaxID=3144404 RepID=UPI0031F55CDC